MPSVPVLIEIINALEIPSDLLLRDFIICSDMAVLNDLTKKLKGLSPEQMIMITDVVESLIGNFKS